MDASEHKNVGIVPDKVYIALVKITTIINICIISLPINWLLLTAHVDMRETVVALGIGTRPVNKSLFMSNERRALKPEIIGAIAPVSLLSPIKSCVKAVNEASAAIDPVKLFPYKCNCCILTNRDIAVGTLPCKELRSKRNATSDVAQPMASGIDPFSLLLDR